MSWTNPLSQRPLYPSHVETALAERSHQLTGPERTAVAAAVTRIVRWRRGQRATHPGASALDAAAHTIGRWCELAQLALDLSHEAEPAVSRMDTNGPADTYRIQRTDEELLHAFSRLADELGRTPTHFDILDDPGLPSPSVLWARFGSLQETARLAGCAPRPTGRRLSWTNHELLEILRERSEKAGRVPSMDAMQESSGSVYYLRFGSYIEAVRLAGVGHLFTGRGRRPIGEPDQ